MSKRSRNNGCDGDDINEFKQYFAKDKKLVKNILDNAAKQVALKITEANGPCDEYLEHFLPSIFCMDKKDPLIEECVSAAVVTSNSNDLDIEEEDLKLLNHKKQKFEEATKEYTKALNDYITAADNIFDECYNATTIKGRKVFTIGNRNDVEMVECYNCTYYQIACVNNPHKNDDPYHDEGCEYIDLCQCCCPEDCCKPEFLYCQ